MNVKVLQAVMRGITAYRDVLTQPIMKQALLLVDCAAKGDGLGTFDAYIELFYQLRITGYIGLGQWLRDALRWSEGPYPKLVEQKKKDAVLDSVVNK